MVCTVKRHRLYILPGPPVLVNYSNPTGLERSHVMFMISTVKYRIYPAFTVNTIFMNCLGTAIH